MKTKMKMKITMTNNTQEIKERKEDEEEENKRLLDGIEGFNVKKVIHPAWEMLEDVPEGKSVVGKYSYLYENENGKISLVEVTDNPFGYSTWEMQYLEEGKIKTKRYDNKEEAEIEIKRKLDLN